MSEREDSRCTAPHREATKRQDQRNDDGGDESSLFDAERNFISAWLTTFLVGTAALL